MRSDPVYGSVMLPSGVVALVQDIPQGMISLTVGLVGVALSRWVFVNREVRRTNQRQSWRETLPLTLVAMLVTGVLVHDRNLSVSSSAFLGLGVGWVAVILLDVFGDKILNMFRSQLQAGPASQLPDNPSPTFIPKSDLSGLDGKVTSHEIDLPEDMTSNLNKIDEAFKDK